jgi:hypothetical protein
VLFAIKKKPPAIRIRSLPENRAKERRTADLSDPSGRMSALDLILSISYGRLVLDSAQAISIPLIERHNEIVPQRTLVRDRSATAIYKNHTAS